MGEDLEYPCKRKVCFIVITCMSLCLQLSSVSLDVNQFLHLFCSHLQCASIIKIIFTMQFLGFKMVTRALLCLVYYRHNAILVI